MVTSVGAQVQGFWVSLWNLQGQGYTQSECIFLVRYGRINLASETTTLLQILTFVLLPISGVIIIYSLWIVLIALTFWFTKLDNNVTILQALLDSGRYPVSVYPVWLRIIVIFIIPFPVARRYLCRGCGGS